MRDISLLAATMLSQVSAAGFCTFGHHLFTLCPFFIEVLFGSVSKLKSLTPSLDSCFRKGHRVFSLHGHLAEFSQSYSSPPVPVPEYWAWLQDYLEDQHQDLGVGGLCLGTTLVLHSI